MEFEKIYEEVDGHLNKLSLTDKVRVLNEILDVPITVKDSKFYHLGNEYDECRMRDLISITQRWFSLSEYKKLKEHFEK